MQSTPRRRRRWGAAPRTFQSAPLTFAKHARGTTPLTALPHECPHWPQPWPAGRPDDGVFEASAKDTPPHCTLPYLLTRAERVSSRMVEPLPKAVHLLQVPLVVPLDCLYAPTVAKQQPARKQPASSPTVRNSWRGQYSAKRHHNIYVPIHSLGPNELPLQVHEC